MSRDVKTVSATATIAEARSLMSMNRVRHLLVRDARGVVGILSDRDLTKPRAGSLDRAVSVAEVMTATVVTASPETTVRQAANLFRGRTIGCLPVMDGSKAVGIVTTTDLLDLIGRGAERPMERTQRWTLRHRGPRGTGPSSRRARG